LYFLFESNLNFNSVLQLFVNICILEYGF
jgi:hypothetical protein